MIRTLALLLAVGGVLGCGATPASDAGTVPLDASDALNPSPPPGMALIPAGAFRMGCPPGLPTCGADQTPQHEVQLDAYFIDRTEVTVAAYQACVDATVCKPAAVGAGPYAKYHNWQVAGREQHPVNGVRWQDAVAYCGWVGGRLPTEAEWEKALRGGLADQRYPWGTDDPTCIPDQPNTIVWYDAGGPGCGMDRTWPVGTGSTANGYGLFDLSGNVAEWVADWYDAGWYGSPAALDNPAGPAVGTAKGARGGQFLIETKLYFHAAARNKADPSERNHALGFRCARSLP
jgi:formylglycine-generating enzyme required for sulfatase activity